MKRFFHKLSVWWFAIMTPERAPLTTIQARETIRKRRLLSSILLVSFTIAFFFTMRGIFFGTHEALLPIMPLFFACVITTSIGTFSAVHVWATTRAVIQADRAVELEQAHHALTEAHTNLETAYEELEVAHATIQKLALADPLIALPNQSAGMNHHEEREGDQVALHGFVEALASLLEQRDTSLSKHSYDVADLVYQISLKLGVSGQEAQMVKMAGHLHDIGKIGISDTILHKPAPLTEEEWQLMKEHTIAGAAIVAHIPALRPLAPVIRAHHERWDGNGYPDRLQDKTIPLAARIISVVDAYMAMIVDRSYQKARSVQEAVAELRNCSGTQFDPAVVEALIGYLQEQALSRENTASRVPAQHA